ncbi:hypothetical protein EVA_20178 [gut metagenome]|uniref:Uncharacterized protein n=1 Tax=gut metagenome TaxID=749906 RepID=J9F9X4_9ZZZZ
MGKTIDLATEVERLISVDENDLILSFNQKMKKVGWINASHMIKGGYACRRWNINHSSPVGEAVGNIEYLRKLPGLLGLGCYLVDKNHTRRKLDPTNHYKLATGEPAKLDGSMGDYMWGWGTKWYYAWWREGSYFYEAASLNPIPGKENYVIPVASVSAIGPATVDRTSMELASVINTTAQYRGGDNNAALDSAFNTQLGRAACKMTAAQAGEYARKKGEGWEAGWYAHHAAIAALFRIIFGTRNMQDAVKPDKDANGLYQGGLGIGASNFGAWYANKDEYNLYPCIPTDAAVDMADGCGEKVIKVKLKAGTTVDVRVPVFFGLKNFFAYMYHWERGILINKKTDGSGEVFVTPKLYSSYSITSLAGMTKVSEVPAAKKANSWEYVSQISMQNLCHKPTVTEATASTYYADGYYNNNDKAGLRVPLVSCHGSVGSLCGPEAVHVNVDGSWTDVYFGVLLCEAAENWDTTPVLVG